MITEPETEKLKNDFTDTEKEECLPVIQKILGLSALARSSGILELEEKMEEEQDFFLKTALQMALDAVYPEVIENTLKDTINKDKSAGTQLLQRLIITQGILSIVNGEPTHRVAMQLTSLLGDSYAARIEEIVRRYV
jgi:flagellar motor component MotA